MNKAQRTVFLLVALILVVMILCPPIVWENQNGVKRSAGYGFLFCPPHPDLIKREPNGETTITVNSSLPVVDASMLCLQFFVAVFLGGALYFFFDKKVDSTQQE